MRFSVMTNLAALLSGGLLCYPWIASAQTSCQCEDPPGGTITCESRQAASCMVVNNKVHGRCQTIRSSNGRNVLDSVLSSQFGETIRLNLDEFREAIRSGMYMLEERVVTFNIPGVAIPTQGAARGAAAQTPSPIVRPIPPRTFECAVYFNLAGHKNSQTVTVQEVDPDSRRAAAIGAAISEACAAYEGQDCPYSLDRVRDVRCET
jgi:hypothetical protein